MAILAVIYVLILIIFALVAYAVMQIRLFGMKIKDFWTSPDGLLVEMVELENHPYFMAGQFHPELKSRPNKPAPLFVELISAIKSNKTCKN